MTEDSDGFDYSIRVRTRTSTAINRVRVLKNRYCNSTRVQALIRILHYWNPSLLYKKINFICDL